MKQKTRNKRLQFDTKTKQRIAERDVVCLFCRQQYSMSRNGDEYGYSIMDITHYVNKSAGGLGTEKNGVLVCRYHHQLLDNGNKGFREEMLGRMEAYLKSIYPDWKKEDLYYRKYDF